LFEQTKLHSFVTNPALSKMVIVELVILL